MADRNSFETEHSWVEERLSAYIDDKIAPLERAQLDRHLRDCARCQASLASLRWTVALARQVPAPALPRAFTLPVPAPVQRAPAYGFGFARLATVVATLLLFAVVGVDLIAQRGGGFAASAPAPAALQNAEKPTSIALAPAVDQAKAATPSAAPEKLQAAPTVAPLPTLAAQPAAPPPAPAAVGTLPAPRAPVGGPVAPVTTTTTFAAGAASIATPVPATPMLLPTATVAIPSATASPSPASAAQALVQPTRAQLPVGGEIETAQPLVTPLRVAEIGLFFFAVFFGALTILLRRRN